jgi:hypothetical protein
MSDIKHAEDCDFEVQVAQDLCASIGDGEISGSVSLRKEQYEENKLVLQAHDGWSMSMRIVFNFCPVCGVCLTSGKKG